VSKTTLPEYTETVTTAHKYKRIAESLRQRIKNGQLQVGDFLPTSKQLAEQYSTTAVTIDRAIGVLVAEGLVTRTPGVGTTVLEPVSRGGAGRGLPTGTPVLVGALLQAQTESHYWERLLDGVNDVLQPSGVSTLIGYHNQNRDGALQYASLFRDQGAAAILFAPFDRPTREQYEADNAVVVTAFREMGLEVIMLDRYIESVPGHFVSEYCYAQGREMIERLIDRGYNRPLCMSTDYVSVIGARERAFIDGCISRGIENPRDLLVRVPLKDYQDRHYDEILSALAGAGDHNLVVCLNSRIFNTIIYLRAREAARAPGNGTPIPLRKLAGFVDIELMDLEDVVAYVEQPVREMGRAAGRMVQTVLREHSPEFHHALVPCELRELED
jgi:DNA-binding LacI/PurR family transcriptional regulator